MMGGMSPGERIQEAATSILAGGSTLRIVVDGRRRDVSVPKRVRAQHGARLIIDVGEQQRSSVRISDEALEVQLAFAGAVAWCRFPWASVHGVADASTGRGFAVPEHAPPAELSAELAVDPAYACSFCGTDRRDRGTVVIAHDVTICDVCVGDAAGLVAARGHASSMAAGIAAGAHGLPIAQGHGILLGAAHLAGGDLDSLGVVLDDADPDAPETTLAILALVPPRQRSPSMRMREAGAWIAIGRGAEARAALEAIDVDVADPAGSLARELGLLRAELAGGVDRARAANIRDAALALGASLGLLADGPRAALSRDQVWAVVDACIAAGDARTALGLVERSLELVPDDLDHLEQRLAALTALEDDRHHGLRAELLGRVDPDGARARRIRAARGG